MSHKLLFLIGETGKNGMCEFFKLSVSIYRDNTYIEHRIKIRRMFHMVENTDAPKKWAKPNIDPETAHIIKKIAVDEGIFIYQLIDKVFRERYPEYFQKSKC